MSFPSEDMPSGLLTKAEEETILKEVMPEMNLMGFPFHPENMALPLIDNKNHLYGPPMITTDGSTVCNEEYTGPYNFEVLLIPNESKDPWVYSSELRKVFINMMVQFPIGFRISNRSPNDILFIRVIPVFSSSQHAQEPVYRCMQHEAPNHTNNRDVPLHVRAHIIRCMNAMTEYQGFKERHERLSLMFPLSYPQVGTDIIRETFEFVCKNSCPSGMNRKSVEIIFTLENIEGLILGRSSVNVRICSCPKRDKEKEEKDVKDKVPRGKKRKAEKRTANPVTENQDLNQYMLQVPIIGKKNAETIIKIAHGLMAGDMIKDPSNAELYKKCLSDLNTVQFDANSQ